jgi:hypothetical protein
VRFVRSVGEGLHVQTRRSDAHTTEQEALTTGARVQPGCATGCSSAQIELAKNMNNPARRRMTRSAGLADTARSGAHRLKDVLGRLDARRARAASPVEPTGIEPVTSCLQIRRAA